VSTASNVRVLVLGARGLLGSTLVPFLVTREYEVKTHSRHGDADLEGDLSRYPKAERVLSEAGPELIVNLVALTNVDQCEASPNEAYLTNVKTVENIVAWIRSQDIPPHLVHMSTDQVYDGEGPHAEERVMLRNYYAFSKCAGEIAAAGVPSTILRTNFFGQSRCAKRVSLSDWLFRSLSRGDAIEVFEDVLFTPLSMDTLSEIIELVMRKRATGVFNVGSCEGMSKADFAFAFAEEWNFATTTMARTSIDQGQFLKAYRPKDMRMDSSKFEKVFGVQLPLLRHEISRAAKGYYGEV